MAKLNQNFNKSAKFIIHKILALYGIIILIKSVGVLCSHPPLIHGLIIKMTIIILIIIK